MEKDGKRKMDSKELYLFKENLRKRLESGECYLSDNTTPSKVWKSFQSIKEREGDIYTGYVRCLKCKIMHKHDSVATGTSHLRKHIEACAINKAGSGASGTSKSSAAVGGSVMTSFFTKTTPVNKKVKKQMLQGAMAFCAMDMRPYEAVMGEGMEALINTAISIGANHGMVNAKEVLPDATTVSRNLKKVLQSTRASLVPHFNSLMKKGLCAATTDMWSDAYRRLSYTTVTLQFTDSDWNIINKVLFTCAYPFEKRKNAASIRHELCAKFIELGFEEDIVQDNVTFVTDQGPNIVKALSAPFTRMNCCAHMLNTVMRNLFKPDVLLKELPRVQKLLVATKALVGFLKHSGISSQLKTAVHQEIETRWNSRLAMLKSVYVNFNDIASILKERQLYSKMKGVNEKLLKVLIEFLEPFKAATDVLEGDGCTINLVLPEYAALVDFCDASSAEPDESAFSPAAVDSEHEGEESEPEDSHSSQISEDDIDTGSYSQSLRVPASSAANKTLDDTLVYLKQQARHLLLTKFVIENTHKVALLLTPVCKHVGLHEQHGYRTITLEDRESIIQELREQVQLESDAEQPEQPDSQPPSEPENLMDSSISQTPSTSASTQPFKKMRLSTVDRLKSFLKKDIVPVEHPRQSVNEVDTYFNSIVDDGYTDVLQWWREHRNKYPILSNFARKVFCIPASSASSERVFSAAGNILQKRRSNLSPESVDAIIFLCRNADFKDYQVME